VGEAVASVRNAKRDDLELIVVDDGSTDELTRAVIDGLAGQEVAVIRQENKGLAAARNAGIAEAQGEYILPLDADDRLRTGWIDRGIHVLDTDARAGVVYGDAACFGARTYRWNAGAFDRGQLLDGNFIHASALYRRKVWEQNGGYDGSMPVQGFEDWDFWLGAFAHGWRFEYLAEVFFDYRQHERSMLTQGLTFIEQTREFVARKHCLLYRQEFLELANEHRALLAERQSVKATSRILSGLLKARLTRKLGIGDGRKASSNGKAGS
jgi:glycosyltransferase involved in cell wall biosynthesis